MKKLEDFDASRLVHNPFVESLRIPCNRKESGQAVYKGDVLVPETYPVERTPHVRIFYTPGLKDRVYSLSPKAMRLYNYILMNLEPNRDYVQINHDNYMLKCKIKSVNTFIEARKELIRYGFITGTEYKSVFFINPDIFFPGSRVSNYQNKIYLPYEP